VSTNAMPDLVHMRLVRGLRDCVLQKADEAVSGERGSRSFAAQNACLLREGPGSSPGVTEAVMACASSSASARHEALSREEKRCPT
jgi:hypothetical protein